MSLPIDRTSKSALDGNLVNGNTSDAPVIKNSNDVVYNTIDELNNKVDGLVGSSALSPYPPSFLYRQAIINGNFDVWQRGTSFTFSSISGYTADRWKFVRNGTGTTTVTQDTSVPLKSQYSLKCVGPYAAGEFQDVQYSIESKDAVKLSGQQVNISLQHKESVTAGTTALTIIVAYASVIDNFAASEVVSSSTAVISSTFARHSFTVTLPATSPTGLYPIGNGIQVVVRYTQSTATGTLTSNLSQVQLCTGNQALLFQPRSFSEEMALCQRYYEKSYDYAAYAGSSTLNGLSTGIALDTTIIAPNIYFRVRKRTNPTVTIYSAAGTSGQVSTKNSQTDLGATGFTVLNGGDSQITRISKAAGTALVIGEVYWLAWTADSEI